MEKKRKPERPSWDEYFMQVANVVKSRSTCLSSAKGAVLVNGRQIISTGYNGTPAGTKHCDEGGCARCLAVKEGRLKSGTNLEACACVLGDTVLLGDNKPIAEYVAGDSVVGMHRLNDVRETFRIDYSGDLIEIEAKGILPLALTPEHPLLVISADNRPGERASLRPEWKAARDLRERDGRPENKGDYLLLPRIAGHLDDKAIPLVGAASDRGLRHNTRHFPLSVGTAWLLGVYVAEGYAAERHVHFSLNSDERRLADRIAGALRSLGATASVEEVPGERSIRVDCRSTVLARVLPSWCGRLAPNKKIPDFILYHDDVELLEAFLSGYSEGVGVRARDNAKGLTRNRLHVVTTSRSLAMQLQLAFARLGCYASVGDGQGGRATAKQGERAVTAGGEYAVRYSPRNTNVRVFEDETHRFFMLPIRSITTRRFTGTVYNLGTAEDNTYLISNIVSHNCCHAEENAIVQAAKNGIPTAGCTIYSTHSPCTYCSKMIINAGIRKVVASTAYPDQLGVRLMKEAGLELVIV